MAFEPDRSSRGDSLGSDAIAFFTETTAIDLAGWLLASFSTNDYTPLEGPVRGSSYTHIAQLILRCDLRTQEKVKRAIARAIAEWRRPSHPLSTLSALCFVASDLHVTEAIPLIRHHLDQGGIGNSASPNLVHANPDEVIKTGRSLVSVLRGFAPSVEAHEALEVLFMSPRISERFSAQLFLGLCQCSPNTFWKYLDRFLIRLAAHPTFFVRSSIASEFVRVVGDSMIFEGLNRCTNTTRAECFRLLTEGTHPALDIHLDNDDVSIARKDGALNRVPVSWELDMASLAAMYQAGTNRLTATGGVPGLLNRLPQQLAPLRPN